MLRLATFGDVSTIVAFARRTAVFTDKELDSLKDDCLEALNSKAEESLYVWQDDEAKKPQGMIHFGQDEFVSDNWFVWWIIVDPLMHGKGVGASLLWLAENMARMGEARQVLIETSNSEKYAKTRKFYLGKGYQEVAMVPSYYAKGDGKCIFAKEVVHDPES